MDFTVMSQFGIAGITMYIAYKMITKLYEDMRSDSATREEKLMEHMEKQGETMTGIKTTMSEISGAMRSMDGRICTLEEYCRTKKDGDEK